jgi:hypothetical protein
MFCIRVFLFLSFWLLTSSWHYVGAEAACNWYLLDISIFPLSRKMNHATFSFYTTLAHLLHQPFLFCFINWMLPVYSLLWIVTCFSPFTSVTRVNTFNLLSLWQHILHCHDWTSAPVAWLYKEHYAQSRLASARVVFTIHNLEFGAHYIGKAMTYCDKATTVSALLSCKNIIIVFS